MELSYLVEHLLASINKIDSDIHNILFENIVLTGSSTTTSEFKEKLEKEIVSAISSDRTFSIIDAPERLYLPWIGGSMMAYLPSFIEIWVSNSEFSQKGVEVFGREL